MPSKYASRYATDIVDGQTLSNELLAMLKYLKRSGYKDVPRGTLTLTKLTNNSKMLFVSLYLQKCAKKKKSSK